jgi:cardiolipin synthase
MNSLWIIATGMRSDIHLAIGLPLAVLVTLHVLLRKRQVASSVGWIGLAWFAPIFGSVAYAVLGINRVQRRALRMRPPTRRNQGRPKPPQHNDDDHLDPLARGVGRITGRPLLDANAITVLHDGDEAYPAMLDAIAHAQRSVGMSSYIFKDDHWGGRFIDALAEAQGRGVVVRALIDGVGGGWLRSPAYFHMRRRGIPSARFLHEVMPWRMPFLNLRSHKKILVIDGEIGFTGGVNIADQNVLRESPKQPVQDTHFRIQGPVVNQLTEAFVQDWAYVTNEDLQGDAWFPYIKDCGNTPSRIIDSGPDDDVEKIEFAILQAISCARTRIMVMTPYFLPDDRLITSLSMAAMRGVAVDVIIPEKSDHRIIEWASRANIGPLLSDGVRIWRSPPPFRHSKIMLVDDEWCLVGSCNWDIRSFRLNFELCLEVYDTALAAALTALIKSCQAHPLLQQEIDARSKPIRLRDAAARLALPYL